MNHVVIHGRVSRDPEIRTTQSGTQFARMSIAVDRYTKAGEERKADFIPCIAWGRTAEFIGKYFTKGKEILAEGRIQTGSYTDDEGKKRYTTDVVLDRVEFCGSKGGDSAKNRGNENGEYAQDEIPF